MPRPLSNKKLGQIESIRSMSNQDLLEESLSLAAGDDYDGCFTPNGVFRFDAMCDELYARLYLAGFIDCPAKPNER